MNQSICDGVEFRFFRRGARRVFLCGEFNDWHRTSLPMTVMDGGWWECRLHLAPGSYRFKYLADGEWYPDYAAFGLELGPLGTWESVVLVREAPEDGETRRAALPGVAMPGRSSQLFAGPLDGHTVQRRTNEIAHDDVEVLV